MEQIFARATRLRRRRQFVRTTLALLCALAIASAVAVVVEHDESSVVAGADELLIPPDGKVAAEWLADGSPVFVTHFDGAVRVFAAFSTHQPFGIGKPISWCESAQQFEDWMHGSWWDAQGHKIDGPAPSDLWEYDVVDTEADRVRVGELHASTSMSHSPRSGLPCEDNETPGSALVHDYASRPTYDLADALDEAPSGHILIRDAVVVLESSRARVCDHGFRHCADVRDALPPLVENAWETRVLAVVSAGALVDVRVLDSWASAENGTFSCEEAIASVARSQPDATGFAAKLTTLDAYLDANPAATGVIALRSQREREVYVVSVEGSFKPSFGRVDVDLTWGACVLDARSGGVLTTTGRGGDRLPFFDALPSQEQC